MKKLFTIVALAALTSVGLNAQRNIGGVVSAMENPFKASMDKAPLDTLTPPIRSGCNDSLFVYAGFTQGGAYAGFIAGTNGFGDKEKAQRFPNSATGGVIAAFGLVGFHTGNGSYSAKIYNVSGNNPGSVIGTSAPTNTVTQNVIVFMFPNPAFLPTADFVVSVPVTGAPGDTIAFATSKFGCGNNESYELWSDNTWNTINSAWGADLDLSLGVIVDRGIDNASIAEANLPSVGIAPNPSNDYTLMGYNIKENGNVVIKLMNLSGQTVMTLNEGEKTAGTYTRTIDVSGLAAGTYLYQVSCNGKAANGRIVVSK